MKLTANLVILTVLSIILGGCATTRIVANCPQLTPPPDAAIDALETAGRADPETADWVVDLDRHYQKLETCK